jgi:hypothetical protein
MAVAMDCSRGYRVIVFGSEESVSGSIDSLSRGISCHMKNYHVVEWSSSQAAFHLQTLAEMIQNNLSVFKGESMTDYLCIGIFETYEQASNYIRKLREMLRAGR